MLAEFASVVNAVRCAAEIQRGMIDREPQLSRERRIKFRIGINLGDIIAERGDIFGDGVNVAARLEELAEPGGICVSGVVRDQIRDKLPFLLEDLGEQNVKNIARPVQVYALQPEAIADLPASSMPIATPRRRPVAGIAIAAATGGSVRSGGQRVVALAGGETIPDSRDGGHDLGLAGPCRTTPVDRRIAVRESQRRSQAAILRRRHHRRFDN